MARSTRKRNLLKLETFEDRVMPASLPVLMVIADQQDFYFQEYNDTRNALLSKGVPVVIAATTTSPSIAHPNSGQGVGSGIVQPHIALANVDAEDYSAIVFVGGWGASMYQYAFNDPNGDGVNDNMYFNSFYNGDPDLNDGVIAPQKIIVNNLIEDFLDADKPVAGICHGVTVLAWARVDGASPLAGKNVVVPHTEGTPAMLFNGSFYPNLFLEGQFLQTVANNAIVNPVSGMIGDPTTTADDVVVDGRIITAENQHSAWQFGLTIAQEVNLPPMPIQGPTSLSLAEGVPGTIAQYTSTDPEGGTITWSVAGPDASLFSISSTGQLSSTFEFDGPTSTSVTVIATDPMGKARTMEVELAWFNVAPDGGVIIGPTTLIAGESGMFTLTGVSDIAADLKTMKYIHWLVPPAVNDYNSASSSSSENYIFSVPGLHTVSARAVDDDGGLGDIVTLAVNVVAAPTVASFQVNDNAAQRSRVTSLTLTFNSAVNINDFLQPAAVRIIRQDGVALQRYAAAPHDIVISQIDVHTLLIEVVNDPLINSPGIENGSLADGRWRIEIPSINYVGPEFHRLYGDADGNATVDAADFALFGAAFGQSLPDSPFDYDNNGVIDGVDFSQFGVRFGRTL